MTQYMHLPPLQVEATPQSQYSTDMPARGINRTFPLPLSSSFPSLRFPSPLRQNKARVVHTVVQNSSTESPHRSKHSVSVPRQSALDHHHGRDGRSGEPERTDKRSSTRCSVACMHAISINIIAWNYSSIHASSPRGMRASTPC